MTVLNLCIDHFAGFHCVCLCAYGVNLNDYSEIKCLAYHDYSGGQ